MTHHAAAGERFIACCGGGPISMLQAAHILRDWSGLKSVIGAPMIGDVLRPCDRKAKTVLGFTPGPDRRSAPRDCRKPGPLRSRTASVRPPPNDPARQRNPDS